MVASPTLVNVRAKGELAGWDLRRGSKKWR
jgi:hypothetical protein